jgi:hypothetical protein
MRPLFQIMKTKFTIKLFLNSFLLIALVYAFLYKAEHHANKMILLILLTGIIIYIFLFLKSYLKYF